MPPPSQTPRSCRTTVSAAPHPRGFRVLGGVPGGIWGAGWAETGVLGWSPVRGLESWGGDPKGDFGSWEVLEVPGCTHGRLLEYLWRARFPILPWEGAWGPWGLPIRMWGT